MTPKCVEKITSPVKWFFGLVKWFYGLEPIEKFTAILCVIGVFQLLAFIQSERAFLSVANMKPINQNSVATFPLRVGIKNGGKSTATGILKIYIRPILPETPEYKDGSETPLPPITAGDVSTVFFDLPIPANDIARIKSGDLPFYIFGTIEYSDEFYGKRTTGFCYVFNPKSDPTDSLFNGCKQQKYTYAK